VKVFIAFWRGLPWTALPADKLQTFTSPDAVFQFQYSPVLAPCKAAPEAARGATAIACFTYEDPWRRLQALSRQRGVGESRPG